MKRLATGAVLAPLLWVLIKLAPPWCFYTVATIGLLRVSWELYGMSPVRDARPLKLAGLLGTAAVAALLCMPDAVGAELAFPLVGTTFLAFVIVMASEGDPASMFEKVTATVFPLLLVSLGLGHILVLRGAPGETGEDLVLLLFLCVIAADTSAFYVGSTIGKRRLSPRISPNKSWEGVAGGMVGSVLAALVAHFWFYQSLPFGHAIAIGLIVGVLSIFGDLCESLIKRAGGCKDSSALFPGHGGLFDRTDSLLFAAPALHLYTRVFSSVFLEGRS